MLLLFTLRFVFKRAWHHRAVLLLVTLSVLATTTVFSGVPLFANAINNINLQTAFHAPGAPLTKNVEVSVRVPSIRQQDYRMLSVAVTDNVQSDLGSNLLSGPPIRAGSVTLGLYSSVSVQAQRRLLNQTTLWFSSSLNLEHITLTAGRLPAPTVSDVQQGDENIYAVEALLPLEWANYYHLKLGDVVEVADPSGDFMRVLWVHLVGVLQPNDLQDPAWFGDASGFAPPNDDQMPPLPLWLDESAFEVAVPLVQEIKQPVYSWFYYLNLDKVVFVSDAQNLRDHLAVLSNQLRLPSFGTKDKPVRISSYEVQTGLDKLLKDTLERLSFTAQATLVGILPGLVLLLLYVGLVAGTLVETKREEIALMRSRGAGLWQMLLLSGIEAVPLCSLALFVAPLLAGQLAYFLTLRGFFGKVPGPVHLALAVPTLQSSVFAGVAACCCLVVLMLSASAATRSNVVALKGRLARARLLPPWVRGLPALLLLALGVYGYLAIRQHERFFVQNLHGDLVVDWVAAISPSLLYLGTTGLGLLLVSPLLRLLDKLAGRKSGVFILLGLREMARRPAYYSRLVLLLSVVISLGLLASFLNGTLATSLEDRAAYMSGADLRLVESSSTGQKATIADQVDALPGVTAGMSALRVSGMLTSTNSAVTVLGVESARFQQVAYWRSDFADQPLAELMQRLQTKTDSVEDVPVLVDDRVLSGINSQVATNFGLLAQFEYGASIGLKIVGTYHYFPTLDTRESTLVCDLGRLMDALSQGSQSVTASNEVWLKLAPNAPRYTVEQVKRSFLADPQQKLVNVAVQEVYNRLALVESLSQEPLHVAVSAAFSLDFAIAALLSVLGFVVFFYLIARQRGFEFGVLRAIGLSLRQLAMSLGWEQLILLLLAFLLGVPLGVIVASLVIPGLSVDTFGNPLVPPFSAALHLQSAWQQGMFLSLCMGASLIASILIFHRLRVQEVLRLGEE